jgi:hypothetical protein
VSCPGWWARRTGDGERRERSWRTSVDESEPPGTPPPPGIPLAGLPEPPSQVARGRRALRVPLVRCWSPRAFPAPPTRDRGR